MSPFLPAPLEPNTAHIWTVSTDISAEMCLQNEAILDPTERARADHLVVESDRIRFIAAHGMLRLRLAHYLGTRPEDLEFGRNSGGKPFLIKPSTSLHFNLSHSDSKAAIAITRSLPCGLDIEKIRTDIPVLSIGKQFFSNCENEWLQSSVPEERISEFFRLWVIKEAILKTVGAGLSIPLRDVDATNVIDGTSSIVSISDSEGRSRPLWVCELKLIEGYKAALAIEGGTSSIRIFDES